MTTDVRTVSGAATRDEGPSQKKALPEQALPATLDWLARVTDPVWIVELDGALSYLNPAAQALLACTAAECEGAACHAVLGGETPGGLPLCRPDCKLRAAAAAGGALRPVVMRRRVDGGLRWFLVSILPLRDAVDAPPRFVHLAHDISRLQRMEEFLRGAGDVQAPPPEPPAARLSPREREVLELLARGLDSKSVARRLALSYATVRNHVQHVLTKLEAHSIQEAISLHLLHGEPPGERASAE